MTYGILLSLPAFPVVARPLPWKCITYTDTVRTKVVLSFCGSLAHSIADHVSSITQVKPRLSRAYSNFKLMKHLSEAARRRAVGVLTLLVLQGTPDRKKGLMDE